MAFFKTFKNKDDQSIPLDREAWDHICKGHPHMKEHLEDIEKTWRDPDIIYQCGWDKKTHLYYRFYNRISVGKTVCKNLYVLVVVDTRNNSVKTAHIIGEIKEGGQILWLKSKKG